MKTHRQQAASNTTAVLEPITEAKIPGKRLKLPEIAAALLFTARTHRRMGTNLRPFQVFKSVYDGFGGMWTVGERDKSVALTYTANKNLYDQGATELARYEPQLSEALRRRAAMNDATLECSEAEKEQADSHIEIVEARVNEARKLMAKYEEQTWVFPMDEEIEVEVEVRD